MTQSDNLKKYTETELAKHMCLMLKGEKTGTDLCPHTSYQQVYGADYQLLLI